MNINTRFIKLELPKSKVEMHNFFSRSYFNRLILSTKADEVFAHGDYFDTIKGVVLYTYNDFFVECWYNVDTNEIEEMKGVTTLECADRYVTLDQIELS